MEPLVEIRNLVKKFPVRSGPFSKKAEVQALQGVSLSIRRGETLGLVGESGCGKSTLGRCVLNLMEPTSGEIFFDGKLLAGLKGRQMKPYRRKMQIIFQDPYSSLNPRMTVYAILEEPLLIHRLGKTRGARRDRVLELLKLVGLGAEAGNRYPHEFSGGQRQRIGIARALAVEPEFIVCDEPVSALDVSIQAQIVNLLMDLQAQFHLTYLFISHDLNIVEHISHQVAVMYLGKIVELGDASTLCRSPKHPYTRALLSAVPVPHPGGHRQRIVLKGEPPKATQPPSGCQFHPRCFLSESRCASQEPALRWLSQTPEHQTACFVIE